MTLLLFALLLVALLPVCALAADGWIDLDRIEEWYSVRYDIAAPICQGGDANWTVRAKYVPDPDDSSAMLLDLMILDQDGEPVASDIPFGPDDLPRLYLPYPAGHDAAMGYTYTITKLDTGVKTTHWDVVPQAISFKPDQTAPNGAYRITWGNPQPKATPWELIMSKMNWSGASCSYTVGTGSKQVRVTRNGRNITFSGGEITSVVRFANKSIWGDDYEADQGWHTESGSYTFHNVTLHDDIYVWAHMGEDYTITLDASVKGHYCMICDLQNGANLTLVNNDIIQSDDWYSMVIEAHPSCSMTITGNGKILAGHGSYYSEEEDRDIDDYSPISVVIKGEGHDNDTALRSIKKFEGNVVVSYDQVKVSSGYPQIRGYCWYNPDPEDPYLGEDIIDPATGKPYALSPDYIVKKLRPGKGAMTEPLAASVSELDNSALYRPLLVASSGSEYYLRSEIMQEVSGKSIDYEIKLVDPSDNEVALSAKSALYIPYPQGIDETNADKYDVTIEHTTSTGVEIYTTADGSIHVTPYGFMIEVSSLSPFSMTWDDPSSVSTLPRTGDRSNLTLCLLALMLSSGAFLFLLRKARRA